MFNAADYHEGCKDNNKCSGQRGCFYGDLQYHTGSCPGTGGRDLFQLLEEVQGLLGRRSFLWVQDYY